MVYGGFVGYDGVGGILYDPQRTKVERYGYLKLAELVEPKAGFLGIPEVIKTVVYALLFLPNFTQSGDFKRRYLSTLARWV